MPSVNVDPSPGDSIRSPDMDCLGLDDFDFSKIGVRPRALNIDRQTSCDERALHELHHGDPFPHSSLKNLEHLRIAEHVESVSPGKKSGVTTPKTFNSFESNPMTAEGWEALRQSLVYFKGQPVGTIAALDPSEDALNYDQVLSL